MMICGSHHLVELSQSTGPEDSNLDLSSVNFVMPMGTTVPHSLCEDLKHFLSGLKFIYHIYGMTEIGGTLTSTIDVRNLGGVYENAVLKIVDPDSGKLCGPHEVIVLSICLYLNRNIQKP